MASRAEQWEQAAKTKPRTFSQGEVTADVTDHGKLLLTIGLDHVNLDRFQALKLLAWLKENFE